MQSGTIAKPIFRLVVCIAAVFAVTAALYAVPLDRRPLSAALSFLFVVLIVSASWGLRYSLFVSFAAALGFSWLLLPVGRFWLSDSRDVYVLTAMLVIGITTSVLSDRARRVAIQRRLTQDALRRSEAYLADAQRLTKTGSWAFNPLTGKTLYWSEEMFRIFGLSPQVGPGSEKFWQLVHPEDHDRVKERVEREALEKREYADEYRIVLSDGTVKHVLDIGHPVFNDAGDVVEFVGTTVDVTDRKRAEEERERLRQLEADLAHMDRLNTLGELAASLAHELNQPITAAITNANTSLRWLARDQPDLQEAREAITRIVKDGTRAAEIINRLRTFYKKGAPPEPELLDLNEVVREMLMLLSSEARRYGIEMRTELAPQLPAVMADRVQLQQVLMNLVINGIEAMKETTGELTIKSQLADDGQVLVSISDTGVGLPADKSEQIFNAFFTTKPQGTGMGLTITRSIVEAHGGRLWATSNTDCGATFHFTLPIEAMASSTSSS
jgi:PAS domain S-box-containing protein